MTAVLDRPAAPVRGSARPAPQRAGASTTAALPRHVAALDGVRGLAVLAVIAYHFGLSAVPGGLLGVDVFFVLSGFLITSLLLDEHARSGRIDLRAFWGRRARRLLPALLLVLAAVAAYAAWFADPAERGRLRADALSSLGFVANWRFAWSEQDYFASLGDPSPLLHTWSLGVEEQFYLLWPLAVVLVLRQRLRARTRLGGAAALLAIGSAAWMAALLSGGTDPSRLYYGTDTHASALLVGAALAAVVPGRLATAHGRRARAGRIALGLAGLAGLGAVLAAMASATGEEPWLYRGGFLGVAVAVTVVVAAAVGAPRSPVSRLMSLPLLRAVGTISYGLYLWHWPVQLVLTGARTGLDPAPLLVARLTATVALAVASYHLVEQPVRRRRWHAPWRRVGTGLAVGAAVALVVAATPAPPRSSVASALPADGELPSGRVMPSAADVPAEPRLPEVRPLLAPSDAPRRPLGRDVRVALLGDSLAFTIGFELGPLLDGHDMQLWLDAKLGCGVVLGRHESRGQRYDDPPECAGWPERWARVAQESQADVVTVLIGRWEMVDRFHAGQWRHLGDPGYDAYVKSQLERVVEITSARGAQVVFLTVPCLDDGESADGVSYPQDDPERAARFTELQREVAAANPQKVTMLDLAGLVCPNGTFQRDVDGVTVRDADGIHFTKQGARWVGTSLLPALARLAEERAASAGGGSG